MTETTYLALEAKEDAEPNTFELSITAERADDDDDDDDDGLKGWEIALIVVGGIIGLIVVVGPFLGYLWRARFRPGDYERLAGREVTGL